MNTFLAPYETDPIEASYQVPVQLLERRRLMPGLLGAAGSVQQVCIFHQPCTVDLRRPPFSASLCGLATPAKRLARVIGHAFVRDIGACAARECAGHSCVVPFGRIGGARFHQSIGACVTHHSGKHRFRSPRRLLEAQLLPMCALSELLTFVGDFPSGKLASYYTLLLHKRQPLAPGMGDKADNKLSAR